MKVFQGEIWLVKPSPKIGSEQKGVRPALVIQNDVANKYLNTTIVALISSSGKKGMPEMVLIKKDWGLVQDSYADFAQIYTIDSKRLLKKIGKIPPVVWGSVHAAIKEIFYKTML
jgi:mRNA interferase MazF